MSIETCGQVDDGPSFSLTGFLDVFYAHDFQLPNQGSRYDFLFNHNRHNELNLNFGYVKGELIGNRYRANLTLQVGTFVLDNYADEPRFLRNLYEAYAGIRLSKDQKLWLDVGIFESHIGFEYAESAKNPTLTRSLVAEHSPYFLAGTRLVFQPSAKWELQAVVANGWQRIQRVEGNSLPSFGTQVYHELNEKWALNWSTLIGTDDPDETRRMRYYNNLYAVLSVSDKWQVTAGFDIGTQQRAKGSSVYEAWWVATAIARYQISEKWATAVRGEYFLDGNNVLIETFFKNGFAVSGGSLNIDFNPNPHLICRLEGRLMLDSRENNFWARDGFMHTSTMLIGSVAVRMF